jgi:hypothetical protein
LGVADWLDGDRRLPIRPAIEHFGLDLFALPLGVRWLAPPAPVPLGFQLPVFGPPRPCLVSPEAGYDGINRVLPPVTFASSKGSFADRFDCNLGVNP